MTFDIRPIWLVAALCSAGFGLIVLLLKRNFTDYLGRTLTRLGVAYLCFAGFFFLCVAGDHAGPFLVYVVGRTLGAFGFVFEYWAIAALKRQKHSRVWLVAPPALLFAALIWFTFGQHRIGLDLAGANLVFIAIMVRNAASLLRREDGRRPFVDMLAAGAFITLALSNAIGAASFLGAGRFAVEYNINNPRLVYATIAAIVVESVLFGLFLLAVSERLNYDFKFQAAHDPLTGLYNRRAFEEIAHREVSGAARTGLPISLFLMDIDSFKRFNEQYGHAIGDFILRAAAEALRGCLRQEDYLCRWGGDQFCALLPGATRKDAEGIATRALAALATLEIAVEGKPISVEVSIGIVTRDDNALEFPLLVKLADVALFQAKANERDRFAIV